MPSTVHIDANRGWGGGQVQSLGLALALSARGEDTSFLVQRGSALASRLGDTHLPWEAAELRGLSGAKSVLRLARRFRELAPEIVHIHDSAGHAAAGAAARLAGAPGVVVTRRTQFPLRRGWLGRLKYERWCDRIVCVSAAVQRRCLEAGLPEGSLVVVPDFVDCRYFDPNASRPGHGGERPTVAVVGRLTRTKGHAVLLRAMKQVIGAIPDARLVICGEGEEEASLRRQVEREGVRGQVEFAGFVPDVRRVLSAADVVAMPSLGEGLGVAALEAMAMARPVVASEAGGLCESVVHGETGLLTPVGDAEALGEAVVALLRDPARARDMGRAGRERAITHFDRPLIVQRLLRVYAEVLEGGAG